MDGPQMMVWAQGERQCVLWAVDHRLELRICDGSEVIHSEPLTPGAGLQQARALRRLYGSESNADNNGLRQS